MQTVLLLALITVSEATIGVFVKLTDGRIPIQTLTFYAMAFAAAFLFIARALVDRQWPEFPRHNVRDTVVIGVLIAAQGGVFNLAMSLVPIANAVIFWSVAPFFVFIFSALFLNERARRSYILIFAIAMAGIIIAKPLGGGQALGNLVALSTGAIYAAMVTYMRHEGKTETGTDIAWSLLVAAIVLSPFMVIAGPGQVGSTILCPGSGLEVPVLLWAVGLGVVSTGFAYFGISIVLKSVSANIYSLVDIIVSPVVAATLGFLIFSEIPGERMVFGGALLLGAGFWLTREMSRGREKLAAHPCQCV
jgi:drug/metabolite transporter (DMT)-like permease